MLILLDKDYEEYIDDFCVKYGSAYLYDLPEHSIKKEILKGRVYSISHDKTPALDDGVRIIEFILRTDGILKGVREPYIEQFILHSGNSLNMVKYLKSIPFEDIPDLEYMLYNNIRFLIPYALIVKKRMLKFEKYFNEGKIIIPYSFSIHDQIESYTNTFNVTLNYEGELC